MNKSIFKKYIKNMSEKEGKGEVGLGEVAGD